MVVRRISSLCSIHLMGDHALQVLKASYVLIQCDIVLLSSSDSGSFLCIRVKNSWKVFSTFKDQRYASSQSLGDKGIDI